jgi:ADP-heptose:LPS heptosyltransferase
MTHLALGDYIYQGAYLYELKAKYPNIQLDIWTDDCRTKNKSWHSGRNCSLQQWLSKEKHLNNVYPIASCDEDRRKIVAQAVKEDYDFIIFVASSRSIDYLKIAKQISTRAITVGTEPKNLLTKLVYNHKFKQLTTKISLGLVRQSDHISDFYNHIFKKLFAIDLIKEQRTRSIHMSEQHLIKSQQLIQKWRIKHGLAHGPTIFINHLSTNKKRDWKLEQISELMAQLKAKHHDILFVINTPPHLFSDVSDWCNKQKMQATEAFSAPEDFFQLPAMMLSCDLIISCETAIMHIASSLNLPFIALIRESATIWQPPAANAVLKGRKRVDEIAASEVANEALKCLALDKD